jgi:uncharacterized protein YjbI with pentapeptide repeats
VERDTFDRLVRLIGSAGTRRHALRLVAVGAFLGGAATLEDAAKHRRGSRGVRAESVSACAHCDTVPAGTCSGKPLGPGKNLSGCTFEGKRFDEAVNLSGSNLSGACFREAFFVGLSLSFRGANASNACFDNSEVSFSNFRGSNVRGASFCGAGLSGADFRGSDITSAQLACATVSCSTILPNGKPAVSCAAGQTCCGAECTDTATDPDNCGACFVFCRPGQACEQGSCVGT